MQQIEKSALDAAGGNAFNIVSLHEQEQDGDRSSNQYGTGKESLEVALHEGDRYHLLQTDSNGVVFELITHDIFARMKSVHGPIKEVSTVYTMIGFDIGRMIFQKI